MTSCTSFGESPIEGSSIRITRGRNSIARRSRVASVRRPTGWTPGCRCAPDARKTREHFVDARLSGRAAGDSTQFQVVTHRKRTEQVAPCGTKRCRRRAVPVDTMALMRVPSKRTSPCGDEHAEQGLQHGRLASAIGADEELISPRLASSVAHSRWSGSASSQPRPCRIR